MGRKSSIDRLPPVIKAAIAGLLKDGRATLDQILDRIRDEFPDEEIPSRSALGRYKRNFDELAKELRETREIADVWAQKFGSEPDSDIGKVTLEVLRTLSYRCGADLMAGGELEPKAIAQLSRAMNYIENAGRLSLKREQELQLAAREEAATTAKAAARKRGISEETADWIRREILGINGEQPQSKPA